MDYFSVLRSIIYDVVKGKIQKVELYELNARTSDNVFGILP